MSSSDSDKPKESCGFFSGLFGSSSGDKVNKETCISCGLGIDDCACNSELKEHLKSCCGYGTLPKLIEKCQDTPGYKDPACITTSSCASGSGGSGGCGQPPPKACDTPPAASCDATPKCDASAADTKKDCDKSKCSGGGGKVSCPPMPPTDCGNCRPAWMSCPPSITVKTYTAPENDRILPLSAGGRNGGGCGSEDSSKCGSCGTEKPPPAKPRISAKCPMNKAACPGLIKEEAVVSIFDKIKAFIFGKK